MRSYIAIIGISWLFSCSPAIEREISKSPIFAQNHAGFYLVDPVSDKVLVDVNGAKYFTPASNTKIFTFYTSLMVLGDSIPAFTYIENQDSIILWGSGDPSFLNPLLSQGDVFDFLGQYKRIYVSQSNFFDDAFGAGWAWDDYQYSFQPEKSSFPVYGNMVHIRGKKDSALVVDPSYFNNYLMLDTATAEESYFKRKLLSNQINYQIVSEDFFEEDIPFMTSETLLAELLTDTLSTSVEFVDIPQDGYQVKTRYSIPADSLYKEMMQESDNFIAEQLMLMNAGILSDSLASSIAIRYSKDSLLFDAPDPLIWVDGSGLSRYNLFTPRTIVYLWRKISAIIPQERLFSLLPSGGSSGTLEDWYQSETPYIYGKTGTLSNNHCLSGFIRTKSGKTLIFSFMNSNYRYGSSTIKVEMERILKDVYEKY